MINTTQLKNQVGRGVFWLLVQNIFTKLIYFFITIWLARILLPADFGIVAACILVINFVNLFVDFGISLALIQNNSSEEETQSICFFMTFFCSVILFALLFLAAPFISGFFNDATLNWYLRVMGIDVILTALEIVPIAVVNKKLQFSKRVSPEILFVVIFGIISLLLARNGYGAWSIIVGTIFAHLVRCVLYWFSARIKIKFICDWGAVLHILKYGYHAFGISLILLFLLSGDNAMVKKVLGNAALGFYALAYTIANLPATHITHIMGTITFPLYSELQDDLVLFRSAFRKVLSLITAISIPASVGIMVLAPLLINGLYGSKWSPVILPLQFLCVFGMVRSILSVCGNVFYANNKHYILKRIVFIQFLIFAILLYPFTKIYGLIGTAIAVNFSQIIAMIFIFLFVSKILKENARIYFIGLFKTLIAAFFMGAIVYFLQFAVFMLNIIAQLIFLSIAGAIIYFSLMWFINRSVCLEFIKFINSLRGKLFNGPN